jgi:hypothetical protein
VGAGGQVAVSGSLGVTTGEIETMAKTMMAKAMFRRALAVLALLACGAGGVEAAPTHITWQGTLWLTNVTRACGNNGWAVNDYFESVFRPYLGSDGNASADGLTIVTHRAAFLMTPATGMSLNAATNYSGLQVGGRAFGGAWVGGGGSLNLTITSGDINFNGASEAVYFISGTIKNFDNVNNSNPGCTLTVKGAYTKRPD